MHSSVSKACLKLPNELEDLARGIYFYLSNSPKRLTGLTECKEFQKFTDSNPRKILHVSCTRWLCLEQVVNRILDQWNALTLFFTSASLEDNVKSAALILEQLQKVRNRMYYFFLSFILTMVNKLNIEFQAEIFRLHKLRSFINTSCRTIFGSS